MPVGTKEDRILPVVLEKRVLVQVLRYVYVIGTWV